MARVARGMRAAVRRMKKEVDTLDRDQRTGVPAMSKTAREDASPRLELSMGASKARGALKEAKSTQRLIAEQTETLKGSSDPSLEMELQLNKNKLKDLKKRYKFTAEELGMNKGGAVKKKKLAKGGFPDLSGDGKVTQKDVLMGRGAMNKGGMYAAGGYVTDMLGKKKK
jgi:hypothetical protein